MRKQVRAGKTIDMPLWRGDGAAPPMKAVQRDLAVSSSMKAPAFTLRTLDGKLESLSANRGKWVLVSFWATWCTPCQAEAPILSQLVKENSGRLAVLAVAVNDKQDKLNAFANRLHPAYTIVDGGLLTGQPALAYGVGRPGGGGSVPVNILVRPDGTIAYVEGGFEAPSPLGDDVNGYLMAKR